MGDDDITPTETPIPGWARRLEKKVEGTTMAQASAHPTCNDHSGLVEQIKGLKEDIVDERQRREKAFTALSNNLDSASKGLAEVKGTIARWSGIAVAVIFVLQVAVPIIIKVLTSGG